MSWFLIAAIALTFQPKAGNNMFPQLSHAGKRIVFTSDRDGGDPTVHQPVANKPRAAFTPQF